MPTTNEERNAMTRKEAMRQTEQANRLMDLGFTAAEAEQLRRISMTLRRRSRYTRIPDRETGAKRRLAEIIKARNDRWIVPGSSGLLADSHPQFGPCYVYLQTDPRGAALYILRPGDVPAGADDAAYYTRGICVY